MNKLQPISFLKCTIEVNPSGDSEIIDKISLVLAHCKPHIKRITLQWEDPSTCESLATVLSDVEKSEIHFNIRTPGQWREPERLLTRITRSSWFSTLIISGFDERALDDSDEYFKELSAHMHRARALGIPIRTETPINERTEPHLEDIIERACLRGATELAIRRQPGAFAGDLLAYRERYFQIFSEMETLSKEGWPLFSEDCVPLCSSTAFSHFCGAGITSCHIDGEGRVYVCPYAGDEMGNVIKTALHRIYLSPRLRRWRKNIIEECGKCPAFARCKGGCRCLGKAFGIARDPLCNPDGIAGKKQYTTQIRVARNAGIIPRFELRRGDDSCVLTGQREFLVFPGEYEELLKYLLSEPTLGEVFKRFSSDSMGIIFQLYEGGYLSLKKRQSRRIQKEEPESGKERTGPGSLINFTENLLVRVNSELKLIHRGNKVLVVHPECASWRCVNVMDFYHIQSFRESTYVSDFLKENLWMPEEVMKPMMTYYYKAGFLEINGLNYWNYPASSELIHPEPLQFIIKIQSPDSTLMDTGKAREIVQSIYRHFHKDRKIIELHMQGSGEELESWFSRFMEEIASVAPGDTGENYLHLVCSKFRGSDRFFKLLENHRSVIELEIDKTGFDIYPVAMKARDRKILLIARILAETPEKMKDLYQGLKDRGDFAVRLIPRFDYDNPYTMRDWGALFLEILEEVGERGTKNKPLLLKELDCFSRNLIARKKAHPCYRHPCGAGTQRVAFDWNGDIYPCVKMIPHEKFNCGPLSREISPGRSAQDNPALKSCLNQDVPVRCRECTWRYFCPIDCPAEKEIVWQGEKGPDRRCGFYKHLFEELCWKLDKNPEVITTLFESYMF